MRLAGIDIGTLTCRLLIVEITGEGKLETLHSDRKMLRLGEGVDRHKSLKPEAIDRVTKGVHEWQQTIQEFKVDRAIAVATSAVRDAHNREEFLTRIKQETGMEVEVINGEEEARRTLLGIRSALKPGVTDVLALDIGGGSTEFILSREGGNPKVTSMDMGVVRVTERFFQNDPPSQKEKDDAQQFIDDLTRKALTHLGDIGGAVLVGTAGSITTLSAMSQRLTTYDPVRIHNSLLTLAKIREMEGHLCEQTQIQRQELHGLESGRAEVIVAGVMILRCIMERIGMDKCVVSEYGLREGVLLDLAQRQ